MRTMIKEMFGDLSPWGKFWVYLGAVTLVSAAGMSFMVGWKMTALHALFLACLSFVTAFIPEAAYRAWGEGKKGVAIGLTVLAVPLFAIEFAQHAAYTAGIRGHELATTKVQNIKYDDARDDVAEAKANLTMFTKRLAELETKQAWAASATADGLRANIETAQKAIDLETARGGCKAKCLALMKDKASLEERIKTLEARDDYTARIEAAKSVIARAREKSAATEHKSSQTEHMNGFLSKAVSLFADGTTKPTELVEDKTQLSTNLAIALAGTGLPALAFFVAGLYRRKEDETTAPVETAAAPAAAKPTERSITLTPVTPPRMASTTIGALRNQLKIAA